MLTADAEVHTRAGESCAASIIYEFATLCSCVLLFHLTVSVLVSTRSRKDEGQVVATMTSSRGGEPPENELDVLS